METYERKNHKKGKLITIGIMAYSFLMIIFFGFLYYNDYKEKALIDYPVYKLSTTEWTSGNVIIEVTNNPSQISGYSFDGGKNFQQSNSYEVLENGTFPIVIKDKNGKLSKTILVNVKNIDKESPQLNFENPTTVQLNSNFSLRSGVVVNEEGSGLSNNYVTVPDKIDTSVEGTYTVTYTVFDKVGNYTEKQRTIIVTDIQGRTYYRYRTSTTEAYQCEPYNCNCVESNQALSSKTCPTGYVFEEPNKCCRTCYKTCKRTNWSQWSDWSQNKVNPSANTEVETKVE